MSAARKRSGRSRLAVVALLAATVGTGGCSITHRQFGTPVAHFEDAFADGTTDFRQVLGTVGPPNALSALDDGLVFLYEYASIEERQFGLSIDYEWLRIFKLVFGRAWSDREVMVLIFDRDGRLRSHQSLDWRGEMGGGSSIQMIFAVMSVVDTDVAEPSPPAHGWGALLLQSRLPEALNRGSSPHTGEVGVVQSGTPTGVGQQALEFLQFPIHTKTTGRR